jgi:3',5'-cyclic AMP phosphodiesterase CpdA
VLAVSGDLTQHALATEFEQARALIAALPGVPVIVPGNHDLSFYNPLRRVVQRLALYKRHITADLEPSHSDDEIVVLGLNTARVPLFRGGSFSAGQLRKLEAFMRDVPEGVLRILVTHHPFDLPASYPASELVRGARATMKRLLESVDVLLAGHHHISHSGATVERYRIDGRSAVFVQAGTALSSRMRGEPNSFNVLRIDRESITIQIWAWDAGTKVFTQTGVNTFRRTPGLRPIPS